MSINFSRIPKILWVLFAIWCALFAAATTISAFKEKKPFQEKIKWLNYDDGKSLAETDGKPIFADFYADWCKPCKRMARTTFQDAAVAEYIEKNFVPVKINISDKRKRDGGQSDSDIAEKYGVKTIPAVIILTAEEKIVAKRIGYMSSDKLISWLEKEWRAH